MDYQLMKLNFKMLPVIVLMLCARESFAQEGVGVNFGPDGVNLYAYSFEQHYHQPPERIVWLREQSIPESEWPLIFETHRQRDVDIVQIVNLRRRPMSWMDIFDHYHISPDFLYLADSEDYGPPYGGAYGYYRKHPKEHFRWADDDLIKLGTVKFLVDSTHRPIHEVIRVYNEHPRFVVHEDAEGQDKHGHSVIYSAHGTSEERHAHGRRKTKGHSRGKKH